MSVTVREARRADAEEIVTLAERVWRAAYGEILEPDTIDAAMDAWYDPERTAEAIGREDIAYDVATAENEGTIVGYVSGHGQGEVARLGAIYVDPDRWGEGIGTVLLDQFQQFCRVRGFERIEFEVLAENEVGQSFYRTHGFEVIDEEEVDLFGETVREQVFAGEIP